MKRLWQILGILTYWVTLPGIWLVLRKTRRTRLLMSSGNKVVVVKPWLGNGKWCLPGGGLHKGEPAIKGAVRETYEEVGITVTAKDCIDYGQQLYEQNGLRFSYHLFGVLLKEQDQIKKQPIEIFEADWVLRSSLSVSNANQDVLVALKEMTKTG
jgi:8-oxo-dGTP pyrophosphatase MutT (NUDIX family)